MNDNQNLPGSGAATTSLVLGIIAVVCWIFSVSSLLALIFGAIGLVMAANATKAGYEGNMLTAAKVLSVVGVIGGVVTLIACACVGCGTMILSI